jgi:two-component system, NarL family, response regulator DegU
VTRVVIVDDHRLVREGLSRTLTEAEFEVVGQASDGAEGLDVAERTRPHVVLMDVSMPVLDGLTAAKRMRTRAPDAKVVILTMHADADLVDRARAAGATGYLLKDASSDEVVAAVRAAADGRQVISSGLAEAVNAPEPTTETETTPGRVPELTARELQILQMLADGCAPAEVAERLVISPKTVRNHLTNVYDKLGVGSRSQAIVVALRHGLIDLPD